MEGHRYRSKKFYTFFDGKAELHSAPAKRDGHYIFRMVRAIQVSYGKVTKDEKKKNRDKTLIEGVPFKKQSIFCKYLPYWGDLKVCHAIDGMHLKKNVVGNTIGLLLETAKIMDTLKLRRDLAYINIRQDFNLVEKGNGRYEHPPA